MQDSQNARGQGLVEYAAILILMVFVVVVLLYLLGPSVGNMYSNVMANF